MSLAAPAEAQAQVCAADFGAGSILRSCSGSGPTPVLVLGFIQIQAEDLAPDQILTLVRVEFSKLPGHSRESRPIEADTTLFQLSRCQ